MSLHFPRLVDLHSKNLVFLFHCTAAERCRRRNLKYERHQIDHDNVSQISSKKAVNTHKKNTHTKKLLEERERKRH